MIVKGSVGTEWVDLLRVKRLSENAKMLVRGTFGAFGYDLSSAKAVFILGHSRVVVQTGLTIGIPVGTYAHIAPCSGLAVKWSIDAGAGFVDASYHGEVGVILIHNSDNEFRVQEGDRIA